MNMQLDLSKNTAGLDLTKVAPSLVKVRAELSWEEHPRAGHTFDLDLFAFITKNDKVQAIPDEVVFFNNKSAFNGAVVYPHDSRDGSSVEELFIEMGKIPHDKTAVEIFVFIHEAVDRNQDFSMVKGGNFKLFDDAKGTLIQDYKLQSFVNGSALHVGSLKRNASGWTFAPVGESAEVNPNQVLAVYS